MGQIKNIKLHIVTDIKAGTERVATNNTNSITMDGSQDAANKFCVNPTSKFLTNYVGDMDSVWKPVSLTYVTYPAGDVVGKMLAWGSLMPIFIIVSFVTLILFRREVHTMMFFLGILVNETINMALKRYFKEPRPCRPGDESFLYTKHGMPSSHAQFMSFFALYLTFFAYVRLKPHESENFILRKHVLALSALLCAAFVAVSRIYLHYHTVEQVAAGLVVGGVAGMCWFFIVVTFLMPCAQQFVNTKLAEYFLIRDSSSIPDILWFEYTATRSEARQRNKRTSSKSQ